MKISAIFGVRNLFLDDREEVSVAKVTHKLSDTFKDYLAKRSGGKIPTDALFSHCAREAFQSQWCVLLDDELIEAMENGIVLLCPDGRLRCFYPRIFTYSADYPEKILISGVRNNGGCPCHRCTIKKCDLRNLGAPTDTERREQLRSEKEQAQKVVEARDIIHAGYAVDTERVEALLKPQSLVPTLSALSSRLDRLNFELLPTLVVDLLHEFEIGVWKNLFIHLIRLLDAFTQRDASTLSAELDARFRATPAFGRDTIRKFGPNASEMKRKAARDYEDLLQCAIPAFESLLPEPHNSHLMRLLYMCAQWHALAKLRLHHDRTLDLLDYTTVRLGAQMRMFNTETCETTATRELQKEADARARRDGKGKGGRKPRKLAVFTIKFHVLGDYSSVIRAYGTTDSYSTETGELCHRMPKAWFERTDRKEYEVQLSQIERRQARLASLRANIDASAEPNSQPSMAAHDIELAPSSRYVIGNTRRTPIDLHTFVPDPDVRFVDPYLKGFIPKLKEHLLPRILGRLGVDDMEAIESCDWERVTFPEGRLFSHKLMRINYTTYDVRREQDVIHIATPQCNVMLLNTGGLSGTEHPYVYARVIGIFHANGMGLCATPLIASTSVGPTEALGFFDPADIVRATHLIPQFSLERVVKVPMKSKWDKHELWNTYFINRFADRDLFMRYQYGMSVGHTYMYDKDFTAKLAVIPSIPDDFDYHMPQLEPTPSSADPNLKDPSVAAQGIEGPVNANPSRASEAGFSSGFPRHWAPSPEAAPGPSSSGKDGEDCLAPATVQDGKDQVLAMGQEDENRDPAMGQGDEDRDVAMGQDDDGSDTEEPNSYEDDMDDDELLAYDEMYGTQHHF